MSKSKFFQLELNNALSLVSILSKHSVYTMPQGKKLIFYFKSEDKSISFMAYQDGVLEVSTNKLSKLPPEYIVKVLKALKSLGITLN